MANPITVARRLWRIIRFGRFDRRAVFAHIYRRRYWGDRESVSGPGSSLDQTAPIRRALPALVRERGVRTLFDAPCGDLHWMRTVLPDMDIDYIGGDIVPDLVARAAAATDAPRARFIEFDITTDAFPAADLWLCRDVLFHLSFAHIRRALDNFARSDIPLVLVTSHTGPNVRNRNIVTGDFRQLDLLAPPFRLPADRVLARFDDYVAPAPPRQMLLLSRETFGGLLG